jgi:hypothetical protein
MDEDNFPDTLIEQMTFPLDKGYYVYVLRKYCNTDDEKFLCSLFSPAKEIIPTSDPDDNFDTDVVTAYFYGSVFEFIENAERKVTSLTRQDCPTCKRSY